MIPVRTETSNFVYRGPTLDIGDVWATVDPARGTVWVDWICSDPEREAIAAGRGVIRLGISVVSTDPPVIEEPPASARGAS